MNRDGEGEAGSRSLTSASLFLVQGTQSALLLLLRSPPMLDEDMRNLSLLSDRR